MKKVSKYMAIDGTIFDTMMECEEYETLILHARSYLGSICLYDANHIPLAVPGTYELDFDKRFKEVVNKATYCILLNDLPDVTIRYVEEHINVVIPFLSGKYRFDYYGCWISYEEDLRDFLKKWELLI